jgi:predicted TPR repeat methyltransferase
MIDDWKLFWENYRNILPKNQDELFFQVGKTIEKKPINKLVFEYMVRDIATYLQLKPNDILLEMCCGNGLLTKPLSKLCLNVLAFDFTTHLIETAEIYNKEENIEYNVGDAKSDFFNVFNYKKQKPNKFLMNDSLAYFTPNDLIDILEKIIENTSDFFFYITGVPNFDKKTNFYNTPERLKVHLEDEQTDFATNNGMGRWWVISDLENIAKKYSLDLSIISPPEEISNYRMNILFIKP